MDFSSSSSSSSSPSQYRGSSAFPANASTRVPIFDGTNRIITQQISSSTQDAARFASSSSPSYSNYAYNFSNYNYSAGVGAGASTAGREEEMAERREERGDRPQGDSSSAAAAAEEEEEREHMFDKVVTPSDVGKLNRLVIPKQHAEKYFPLDSSSSEKGLLLDFEDRSGKSWRFRYSYWNSSQSYVMTKGWSRFVKEKKLDAGDVVSFQRGLREDAKDHFYIDWRRRPEPPHPPPPQIQFQHGYSLHHHRSIHHPPFLLAGPRPPLVLQHQARDHRQLMSVTPHPNQQRGSVISYNGLGNAATNSSGYSGDNNNYNYNYNYNHGVLSTIPPNFRHQEPVVYMRGPPPPHHQMPMEFAAAATSWKSNPAASSSGGPSDEPMVFDSVPVVPGGVSTGGKRLRLFGVNMDCTVSDGQANPTAVMTSRHSSPSADEEAVDGSLQLSLHGGPTTTSATASDSAATTDLLDKGKSSMSLDFDL